METKFRAARHWWNKQNGRTLSIFCLFLPTHTSHLLRFFLFNSLLLKEKFHRNQMYTTVSDRISIYLWLIEWCKIYSRECRKRWKCKCQVECTIFLFPTEQPLFIYFVVLRRMKKIAISSVLSRFLKDFCSWAGMRWKSQSSTSVEVLRDNCSTIAMHCLKKCKAIHNPSQFSRKYWYPLIAQHKLQ